MPILQDVLKTHGIGVNTKLSSWYGSGKDGVLNTTANVTIPVPNVDTDLIVMEYESVTINPGHTLTTSGRCRGLIIYSKGDVVINGTISMDGKGPLVNNANYNPVVTPTGVSKLLDVASELVVVQGFGSGGNGGRSGSGTIGQYSNGGLGSLPSKFGGGRGGGGGGGSLAYSTNYVSSGSGVSNYGLGGNANEYQTSSATIAIGCGTLADPPENTISRSSSAVSGINGAGGTGSAACYDETYWTGSGTNTYHGAKGGSGGASTNGGGGGGGGAAVVYTYSGNTTSYQRIGGFGGTPTGNGGGLILIIAKGNIIINPGGRITANGANGGNGGSGAGFADTGSAVIAYGGGGGGGCGGGCVYLLHKGSHSNNGSITVNGGSGGTGGNYFKYGTYGTANVGESGQPGTIGTIYTQQLI